MAHKVTYKFNGVAKELLFNYSDYHNMHEAVAAEEGIDLTHFLQMEQEIAAITREKAAARNFRDNEFKKMGFEELYFWKNGGDETEA